MDEIDDAQISYEQSLRDDNIAQLDEIDLANLALQAIEGGIIDVFDEEAVIVEDEIAPIDETLRLEALESERLAPTTNEAEATLAQNDLESELDDAFLNEDVSDILLNEEVDIQIENVTSEAFDEDGYLTIKQIKETLTPILEDLYPDRWDWNKSDEIIVHFPKILIINSKNDRHVINDIYVKLEYSHINKQFNSNIEGARFSITNSELNGGYSHSHLPSTSNSSIGNFSNFCLGSSTLKYLLSDLATIVMIHSNIEDLKLKFMLSLMEIENYLQWESLEGVPHKYIKYINSGKLKNIYTEKSESLEIMKIVWGNILHKLYTPRLKFNHKGLVEILNNDGFLIEISKYCNSEHLVYRDNAGKFFTTQSNHKLPEGHIVNNNNSLIFKEIKIIPKIIGENKIYEKSGKEFAHPQIIKQCAKHINTEINKYWSKELSTKIISHYISRKRKTKNIRKSIFATIKNVRNSIDS